MDKKVEKDSINILIIDDVISNLVLLSKIISNEGYIARPVTDVKQAIKAIEVERPNLILLDVSMPEMTGFEFCSWLKSDSILKEIPVIFVSAFTSTSYKMKAFEVGAVDYIVKPFVAEEVGMRITAHVKTMQQQQNLKKQNKRLQKLLNDKQLQIKKEQMKVIYALNKFVRTNAIFSQEHMNRVGKNAKILAMSLQLSPKFEQEINNSFIDMIEIVAPLHDIGMLTITNDIINKSDKLNKEEMDEVKKHTQDGTEVLQELYNMDENNEYLKMAIDIAQAHHERFDGAGYPRGLAGKEIPLAARILAVVDVYDVLTRETCYKKAFTHEDSMNILNEEAGKCFDPDIVEIFNKIQNQIEKG